MPKTRTLIWLLLLGCGSELGGAADPAAPTEAPPDPTRKAIRDLAGAQAEELAVPAMAVGVVRGGELVSVLGYGSSGRAAGIDAETVFRIGSVTKVFTAIAVLHLRDAGKLGLDDPVAKFLPELEAVLSPEGREPVRVRHLLQHTSGVPTLGDGSLDWTGGEAISEEALVASVANSQLNFEPGTATAYSNVGMALAGLVVARASGESYRRYVEKNLLEPLEMTATAWEEKAYAKGRVVPGYLRAGGEYVEQDQPWVLGAIEPAGGLYSTVADMGRFLAFQADPGSVPGLLASGTVAESQTKSAANSPHGLGWVVEPDAHLGKIVWHNGATYAYGAWAGLDPARGHGVVVFVSTGQLAAVNRAGALGKDVLRILAGLEPKHTEDPDAGADPTNPEVIDAVSERFRQALNAPGKANLEAMFSAAFLEKKPAGQLRPFLKTVHEQVGACARHELLEDAGGGRFQVTLHCDGTNVQVSFAARSEPPHLLDGLLIEPAP